jgi:hypothetical protein
MITLSRKQGFPNLFSRPTAHNFSGTWDSLAVARLIAQNSGAGRCPAFLYLGRTETELLRGHLGEAYGEDAVSTLHETYYMGLKVVSVDAEQYISTGGSKATRTVRTAGLRRAC